MRYEITEEIINKSKGIRMGNLNYKCFLEIIDMLNNIPELTEEAAIKIYSNEHGHNEETLQLYFTTMKIICL